MTTLLFVYGTLRRASPHPMAQLLADRATYLGPARLPGRLYDLGRYPGVLPPATDADWVHGDLYDLGPGTSTLEEMDAYEQVESPLPFYFERRLETVTRDDACQVQAWVYWFRGEAPEEGRIASGDYFAR